MSVVSHWENAGPFSKLFSLKQQTSKKENKAGGHSTTDIHKGT